MLLIVLAYLGGVLTILSPCILPVLPFVFARADQPFVRTGLPLLAGMALTFAVVATLAAVGGGWVAQANQAGRWIAIVLLAVFGLTLLMPRFAEHLTRPLVAAGNRLTGFAQRDGRPAGPASSLLLGVATGLLWAPCAGPILGLVLTGAALRGASVGTTLLLVAYAAGAATSLGVALVIGGKVFAAMKRSLGAGEWIRRGIGAALLAGVGAIALGLDTGALAQLSTVTTGGLETKLVDRLGGRSNGAPAATPATGAADNATGGAMMAAATDGPQAGGAAMAGSAMMRAAGGTAAALPVEGTLPSLDGAVQWLNSPPLTAAGLRGKVVLVDFWTYSCINCLRTLPYTTAWARKYAPYGLVVIGVHAPEFAFERDIGNVKKAVHDLGIDYPVAIDNGYAIWRAFNNEYWPAHYFIDAQGRIRHHHFGEGEYAQSERAIQSLLAEAGHPDALNVPLGLAGAPAKGALAAADSADVRSPETYVGYARAESFASPGGVVRDAAHRYDAPGTPDLNGWGLAGTWNVGAERASLAAPDGRIVYRFHARDLHLVLGPGANGRPVRFRVTLDGAAPGAAHGADVDAQGYGTVTGQRLYQLVRQPGAIADRTFAIEFLDPGVDAYAFTFG
ncbi:MULTISPECIES: cytochrome c biogenesis protein DipZ [Burkholderia]|uniref:cytochrome c biogenesis protein DipZ n=1 Tax=Burkholderia TaxID=32008 RepID=UPI000DAC8F6D|nr:MULTISPECIES: cytochrome c biogenesis protein DipZ [Burkholderia]MDP9549809.1 cytochrome c biogenesis protein CcdA/thiol-disulfide isomerase/thioredoxin [Burkholderia cepacia]MBR8394751.1 cytochrome c biogenesis protein DipZ [Burkholderia cenocepacia]MBR8473375.1 cytochrome c biogenesis protein DipZ [Burkholderia cenocepacia]MBR8493093.1 cytochrome c biogenesis protein DipZ [Burkholderia cenocepacia]MDO5923606.1 cytochrome c biogenesis protein DipZ [Burkholderia cenocepacia]